MGFDTSSIQWRGGSVQLSRSGKISSCDLLIVRWNCLHWLWSSGGDNTGEESNEVLPSEELGEARPKKETVEIPTIGVDFAG